MMRALAIVVILIALAVAAFLFLHRQEPVSEISRIVSAEASTTSVRRGCCTDGFGAARFAGSASAELVIAVIAASAARVERIAVSITL